jgi:site-specific DNA recombinase
MTRDSRAFAALAGKTMRTLIYARYSSDRQNARSIDAQVADCRARCAAEGWTVVDVYHDQETSGAAGIEAAQRPGFAACLARIEAGGIDQLLADSTSRIARDQADGYTIRRRIEFAGARLFALSIGEVDDIKGLVTSFVDAQARKDIAHNTRRGQREIVREGRAPAGIAYGYRQANRIDERGQPIRGLRQIDEAEAAIVRRIFAEAAAGDSARAIAHRLNGEGVPGPRGAAWRASVIHGDAKRGNGLLRNRLYNGELIVGRTRKMLHPVTRKTVIRPNAPETWTVEPVEALRIVDAELFAAVQARLAATAQTRPEQQRRAKFLLSRLGVCGVCGGGWIKHRAEQWGCSRNRDGGGCTNSRTIVQAQYEARVLAGLKSQLLDPELVTAYVRERHRQFAKRAAEDGRTRAELERKRDAITRKIQRLIDAIAADGAFAEIRDALARHRADRDELEHRLAAMKAVDVIALHPGLADIYRRQVEQLETALASPESQVEAVPQLRALISRVVLTPSKGRGVDVHVEGRLDQILGLSGSNPADLHRRTHTG